MLQIIDKEDLLGALIGLVKACQVHEKTDKTDQIILDALCTASGKTIEETTNYAVMTNIVRDEKQRVAPGCVKCLNPCGNTDEYDMREMYAGDQEIKDLKLKLLDVASGLASKVELPMETEEDEKAFHYICKALSVISYDSTKEHIKKVIKEGQDL